MFMSSARIRTMLASVLITALLTACGGGGGGGSALPAPGGKPPAGGSGSTQTQQQQGSVNAASQQARAEKWAQKYVPPSGPFRKTVHDFARRVATQNVHILDTSPSPSPSASPSAPPCNGGSTNTVTQNSDGSITIENIDYYDGTCNMLEDQKITIVAPDPSGKMNGSGTDVYYDTDGKTVTDYQVLGMVIYNANPGSGDLVMQVKHFPSQSAANASNAVPTDTDYFSSVDTAPNTEKIGAASITQDPTFPGRVFASNSTYTTTYSGGLFGTNQTITNTGNSTNLMDPAGNISVAYPLASGQYQWNMTGGKVLNTTTESETATYDSVGKLLSYTDTITDAADDMTTTITGNVGGTQYKGVIKQTSTGLTLATFTVDANGNGTITFANGTTLPVVNWCWNQ